MPCGGHAFFIVLAYPASGATAFWMTSPSSRSRSVLSASAPSVPSLESIENMTEGTSDTTTNVSQTIATLISDRLQHVVDSNGTVALVLSYHPQADDVMDSGSAGIGAAGPAFSVSLISQVTNSPRQPPQPTSRRNDEDLLTLCWNGNDKHTWCLALSAIKRFFRHVGWKLQMGLDKIKRMVKRSSSWSLPPP